MRSRVFLEADFPDAKLCSRAIPQFENQVKKLVEDEAWENATLMTSSAVNIEIFIVYRKKAKESMIPMVYVV